MEYQKVDVIILLINWYASVQSARWLWQYRIIYELRHILLRRLCRTAAALCGRVSNAGGHVM